MKAIEITAHLVSDEEKLDTQLALVRAQPVGGIVYLYAYISGSETASAFERRGYLFDVESGMSIWRLIEKAAAWAASEAEK